MHLELNLFNFIYILSCSFGYILGFVLLSYGIKKKSTSILLGLSFIFLSHGVLLAGLIDSGLIVYFPAIYRTGNLAGLIFAFLPFLYIQYSLFETKFKFWHLIHLIPAIIYFIDFLPVFMMDSQSKIDLIQSEISSPNLIVSFSQSRIFPDNFHTEFRTVLISFYWLLSVGLAFRFKFLNKHLGEKRILFRWILTYLFFQLIMIVPFYFTLYSLDNNLVFKAVHFTAALLNLSTGVFLLYYPQILYGTNFYSTKADLLSKSKIEPAHEERTNEIDPLKAEELERILNNLVKTKKVYLKKGYSIYDLAKDSGIPHYLLSQFINQRLGVSFPDFINKARVIHSCALLDQAQTGNFTLEAIGQMSGFSNRNSFSSAFKKVTGKSPSVYLKEKEIVREEGSNS